ncbi:methylated-DNA--[protein]-cysteine S-methyltransferase [Cystobacter fuscus]
MEGPPGDSVGRHRSYARLARHIGREGASRAVGSANARNPLSIVVPCHRVVGSSGALTGYAGGCPPSSGCSSMSSGFVGAPGLTWMVSSERGRGERSHAPTCSVPRRRE